MAKPTSRQGLIDYCLRRLGAPVLEINLADDQIDDLVDDALQYFQERHFDGVERMYLKYNQYYDGPNGVAYFDNTGKLIGAASTESYVENTNYVLTTTNQGIPVWSSVIEGGTY